MVNAIASTKCTVLLILRGSSSPVSGEELAALAGVSRVAVWKTIRLLQEAGYGIVSSKKGYMLADDLADSLYPWEFGTDERLFTHFAQTSSTMTEAHRIAENGNAAHSPQIVTADAQTQGRGQDDRPWTTTEGSLAFTLINRVPLQEAAAHRITMAAQIALADVLTSATGRRFYVRWPNDLWTETGKVAGILSELSAIGNRCRWINEGIGLNMTRCPDSGACDCVFPGGNAPGRKEILQRFLEEFGRQEELAKEDSPVLAEEWNARCPDIGRLVRLQKRRQEAAFTGINSWGWASFSAEGNTAAFPPGTESFIKGQG
ncbi:MAG TPA: biotin--[acetyl-CoA-carboxylase] ligase [Treponema sp.]|nr:biotin--[acetyl-CoA-carboxylase] ligase [Treponema sp.]